MAVNSPVWISHRGFTKGCTENTREAFHQAIEEGFFRFETDLRCTQDGAIALCHDSSLRRLNGSSRYIHQVRRQELDTIRLTHGEKIYFFDKLVEDFSQYCWIFDIKPETGYECVRAIAKWADDEEKRAWIEENVFFLFWDKAQEELCHQTFPSAKFYARRTECWSLGLAQMIRAPLLASYQPDKTYSLPIRYMGFPLLSQGLVNAYHELGLRLLAYLPKDERDARFARDLGVDEILTDGRKISS